MLVSEDELVAELELDRDSDGVADAVNEAVTVIELFALLEPDLVTNELDETDPVTLTALEDELDSELVPELEDDAVSVANTVAAPVLLHETDPVSLELGEVDPGTLPELVEELVSELALD